MALVFRASGILLLMCAERGSVKEPPILTSMLGPNGTSPIGPSGAH